MRDKKIVAPPVYRPQPPPRVLQTKRPAVQQQVIPKTRRAVAPPVYRPQPVPKILQTKTIAQLARVPLPAYSPALPKVLQRKPAPPSVPGGQVPSRKTSHTVAPSIYRPVLKKVVQPGITSFSRPVIQRAMEDPVETATAEYPVNRGKSGKPDPNKEKKDPSNNQFAGLMDEE